MVHDFVIIARHFGGYALLLTALGRSYAPFPAHLGEVAEDPSDRRHAEIMRRMRSLIACHSTEVSRDDALMHPTFIIDREPRRDFTGPSLILFILLSIFSMLASIDPATRDEAAAKIVATLQVASNTTDDDDDEPPVVIVPSTPRLKLITLRGCFEAPQSAMLPHLQFESAFDPRGPPLMGDRKSAKNA